MPLFEIAGQKLSVLTQSNFALEKNLQKLVERNLETVFNCRLVQSEFPTGVQHSGRIDTLALSEDDNPVIIEYKKVESSELVNQSLYYLAWLKDHKGDFERAVQKALGNSIEVDWSEVRVICIAPNYKKYDLYAVQMMGANIELWAYHLFENRFLYLEKVLQTGYSPSASEEGEPEINGKNPVMVAAGKKAALTRATGVYTFEEHLEGKSDEIKELAFAIQEFITGLDSAIEEVPKKNYIAYKISQNIVCMELQNQRVLLYLKLNPKEISNPPKISRDMTGKGHYAGDFEISVKSMEDFEIAKPYIVMAYQKLGG